ncbi:MAG: hypothetical protein ACO2ZM_09720, partial [Francisellaceae bacterium]
MIHKLLNALKAQPAKPIISDDEKVIKKQYRYWRIRLMYSMIIGYAQVGKLLIKCSSKYSFFT